MDKIKRRFLFAATVLIAFVLGHKEFASAKEPEPSGSKTKNKDRKNLEAIEKTQEWKELKKRWLDLKSAKGAPNIELDKEVARQKDVNNRYLTTLVSKGYITQEVSFILNYVYGEVLFHKLRSSSGWTCYKMTQLGAATGQARGDLENRMKLLSDISGKGNIDENLLEEAKDNIARDIEFLNRAQKLFDKGSSTHYGEDYWEEEKALVALFKDGKVDEGMKAGSDITEAAGLIIKLNLDTSRFDAFSEWSRIKSNWKNVSEIGNTGYDAMDKLIAEKKKENRLLLSKLVNAGLLSEEGAEVFNDIYGDRIYHRLRPMAATCYEPSILGFKQQNVRDDIESRLKLLADIAREGSVNNEVVIQARKNLEKDMEMVLLINGLWKNGKEPEQGLLSYFTEGGYANSGIKDSLKVREGVKEAVRIIQLLYND